MTPSEEWNRLTLLEKLRKLNVGEFQPGLYAEAADEIQKDEAEIERLRAKVDWIEGERDGNREAALRANKEVYELRYGNAAKQLEAEIERLRKDRDYWYMRYGEVGRGGARDAALEEAARIADDYGFGSHIRALRAQHVVHSAPQSTMEGVFAMGDPEKTDLAVEIANLVGKAIEQGADVEEVKAVLNEVLDELEAQEGDEEDGAST